jgi:predicted NUDIX family NTP pyrophosphohydrolase
VARKSAGFLLYRLTQSGLEVFLVHPGGPFWAKKDDGSWSIPKGEFADNEDPLEAAKREFQEETSMQVAGDCHALKPARQPDGKIVYAWAIRGDVDPAMVKSNSFQMEWPPRSGKVREFPEVDRAGWFPIDSARRKILKGQRSFLDELEASPRCAEPQRTRPPQAFPTN